MFHLPNNIIQIIYSYDPTYHLQYNKVKQEFDYVNSFWGLKFHNQAVTEMSSNNMKSTLKNIVDLSNYWNHTFLSQNFVSIDTYSNWYTKNGVCSPSHYTDINKWSKIWSVLKSNITSFKFLVKKKVIELV